MESTISYDTYVSAMRRIADLRYASAVLQWDQETYLPPKGGTFRGQQIATLNELSHEMFTASATGQILHALSADASLDHQQKRNIVLTSEDYDRNCKLPAPFVRKLTEAIHQSFHAWIQARRDNSFAAFAAPLAKVIELKKQEAEYIGYEGHPYNALMQEFDRSLRVDIVDSLFAELRPNLGVLLDEIRSKPQVNDDFLRGHFPKDIQWAFGLTVLKEMGYDFEAGRQDISEHPFTTNFSSQDVRVTTRVDENDFSNMLWSCIHEGGHALYEQGLPVSQYGLPLGEYCSLSIHESQSRLWENNVGRGLPFWKFHYPKMQAVFPDQFGAVPLAHFYRAINKVQPSLIRTEADELTYHFHVMIRYEIEKLLIEGTIQAADIPAYWNEHYLKYLGVTVPDDKRGCLQDVHWSHGSFGYFATYSIGSLYAAQFYAAIEADNASLSGSLAEGNYAPVHTWLQQHIYPYGRYYTSEDLCEQATGSRLDPAHFINYATKKYASIYGTNE